MAVLIVRIRFIGLFIMFILYCVDVRLILILDCRFSLFVLVCSI